MNEWQNPGPHDPDERRRALPVEVEIYINPDGSVTFADLETGTVPIAQELNPDDPLVHDDDNDVSEQSSNDEPA